MSGTFQKSLGTAVAIACACVALDADAHQRRTLIRNAALVLTMDPNVGTGPLGQLQNVDVMIKDDEIEAIGPNLQAPSGAIVVNASGKIVLPGFIDTHDHLWQSFIRGCGSDQDVVGWLAQCVFPLRAAGFSGEHAYLAGRLSTLALLSTGVTTTVDWSSNFTQEFTDGAIQALVDSKIRFHFGYRLFNTAADNARVRQLYNTTFSTNPLATLQIAGAPLPTPSGISDLQNCVATAQELGVILHVHLYENIAQRNDNQMDLLRNAGAFDLGQRFFTAHTIHLSDAEIAELASIGSPAAHNPLSNMRLASGVMRLPALVGAGMDVGLGLDGGTNDTADMFNNMRVAVGLQRATAQSPTVYPTMTDVLRMATIIGAETIGMENEVGSLTPGKKADIIIIDPVADNFSPRVEWVAQIVLNAMPKNVKWVFVNGRPLKANGHLTAPDAQDIIHRSEVAAAYVRSVVGLP